MAGQTAITATVWAANLTETATIVTAWDGSSTETATIAIAHIWTHVAAAWTVACIKHLTISTSTNRSRLTKAQTRHKSL